MDLTILTGARGSRGLENPGKRGSTGLGSSSTKGVISFCQESKNPSHLLGGGGEFFST